MLLLLKKYTAFVALFILIACNDDEINLLKQAEVKPKSCYLIKAEHGFGRRYNFSYNTDNQLIKFDGFPDFDKIVYTDKLATKVIHSNYFISYKYDANNALIQMAFVDQDNKALDSKVYTNAAKLITEIDFNLPRYNGTFIIQLEYDKNKNISKIYSTENGKKRLILENLTFDDKKSPYLNSNISNIMMYFIVFSALTGSEDYTYFANNNNATSSKIYTSSGEILYTHQFEYNENGYPIKSTSIKRFLNREDAYNQAFVYDCKE